MVVCSQCGKINSYTQTLESSLSFRGRAIKSMHRIQGSDDCFELYNNCNCIIVVMLYSLVILYLLLTIFPFIGFNFVCTLIDLYFF